MMKHHFFRKGFLTVLLISLLLCTKATKLKATNTEQTQSLPILSADVLNYSLQSSNLLEANDTSLDSNQTEDFSSEITSEDFSSTQDIVTSEQPTEETTEESTEETTEEITEEPVAIDTTYLQCLIEEAQAIPYDILITASYEKLDKYLKKAIAVVEDKDSTQAAVDKAATTLKKVLDTLQYRATDKSNLKAAIDEAKSKEDFLYVKDSYKKLCTALDKARKIYKKEDTTQATVEKYTQALWEAIFNLTLDVPPYKIIDNTYYYNVTDFGADGTDKKDDLSAIQAALDKARKNHSIVVWIPAGQYYISGALYLQSNTTLKLDEQAIIKRSKAAIDDFNMLRVSDFSHNSAEYTGYSLCHDITIIGGTWDGGSISKATQTKNLIYIGHSKNVTISNTTIKNCYGAHALEFAGVYNGNINHCTFTGFRYSTDKFTDEAIQIDICDQNKTDKVKWAPGYNVDGTTCKNIVISNNTFIDYPRGVGSHHIYTSGTYTKGKHSGPYENITIKNNTFRRSAASNQYLCSTGIFIMGAKNIKISKNTVNRYSYGIWVKNSSKISVKKNTLKFNNKANIIYSNNKDMRNLSIRFSVTQAKPKSKEITYTCPTIKTGYLKTKKKIYRFKKEATVQKAKLKKKIVPNQKVLFYGKDKNDNIFYSEYMTLPK